MKKNSFTFFLKLVFTFFILIGCGFSRFKSESSEAITDPLMKYAWHIDNYGQSVFASTPAQAGYDLHLSKTWTSQIYGSGVVVQLSDDGLEDTHEDLHDNFPYLNKSKNYMIGSPYLVTSSMPIAADDDHGTCVAGLIAAVAFNGVGSRGVAPKAHLTIANFLSSAVTITGALKLDQATGDFDISNMSWGTTENEIMPQSAAYAAQIKSLVTTGRNGKGTIFVKASGNDFAVFCKGSMSVYCVGNANFDADNALPYMIVVGALNATGLSASYSSTGSNIWVSTFGGEFGSDSPAMLTTDRTGCVNGYAKSSQTTAFEKGASVENVNCNYTSTFNGTSSAAPVLSGVIALLLEANSNLTWRQIKYIFAKSSKTDFFETGSIDHPLNSTLPTGYLWEQKWITNAAGYKFHNWYGFGRADVDAAVALAKAAITTPIDLGTFTETNWAHSNTGLALPIPDNNAAGITNSLVVATNLKIEAVQIKVGATHADISELALELTSPSGTKSILVNARNSLTGIANYTEETFLSNAFYQESSAGTWTLKVVDAKVGIVGTLTSFKLNFVGGAP